MQALDDQIETIHLYVVREAEKRPYTAFPLFCAFLCLLGIVVLTLYSTEHPYYEHKRITVPAQFLPIKVFTAEAPIIPTGLKTYPATYAHGFLTFSNGSVIGQSVPEGFTIDGAVIDKAIYVPPATANGFGLSTVSAHLLTSGINLSTLSINEVIGPSLFIRNLSPFTGGRDAYSVKFVTSNDRDTATSKVRAFILSNVAQVQAFLSSPCKENLFGISTKVVVTWECQFVSYKVPSYMTITAAKLSGKNFLVDVLFIPPLKPMPFK